MAGLATLDAWAWAAIVAKAVGYAAALVAMGGALFLIAFPPTRRRGGHERVRALARNLALAAAGAGALVLGLRFALRAARISGMGMDGATDAVMLGLVWDSPLGTSAVWRLAGFVLVLALAFRTAWAPWTAALGSVAIAVSYAQVGHSLGDPRWLLGSILVLHLLAAAFWVAALLPLRRAAADGPGGAALLHRFGQVAVWTVGGLAVFGVIFAFVMSGATPAALLGTAYGWTLLGKVALVTGLLGLAAINKLRLVPALAAGKAQAAPRLRRSIAFEIALVVAILLLTAALTSVTVPPVNMES